MDNLCKDQLPIQRSQDVNRHLDDLLQGLGLSLEQLAGDLSASGSASVFQSFSSFIELLADDIEDGEFICTLEELYDLAVEHERSVEFYSAITSFLLNRKHVQLPSALIKDLVRYLEARKDYRLLEVVLVHIDIKSIDFDQVLNLAKSYYQTRIAIYVYTQAFDDFFTPLIDLLDEIESTENEDGSDHAQTHTEILLEFLRDSFIGLTFPDQCTMTPQMAEKAKACAYSVLFSDKRIERTERGSGTDLRLSHDSEGPHPYFRTLLSIDSEGILSILDTAFEDSWLNGHGNLFDSPETTLWSTTSANVMSRQYLINNFILMCEKYKEYNWSINLCKFIARNIPKYPQFIILSGAALEGLIMKLSEQAIRDPQHVEQYELHVEYIHSTFRPANIQKYFSLYKEAKFYRILKNLYREDRCIVDLLKLLLLEGKENEDELFKLMFDSLNSANIPAANLRKELIQLISEHAVDLVSWNPKRSADIVEATPEVSHAIIVDGCHNDSALQYGYLRMVLETPRYANFKNNLKLLRELYIMRLCEFDKDHLIDYIRSLESDSVSIDIILPILERQRAVKAKIIFLMRCDKLSDALAISSKELQRLLKLTEDAIKLEEVSISELLDKVHEATLTHVELCKTACCQNKRSEQTHENEQIWIDLIERLAGSISWVSARYEEVRDNCSASTVLQALREEFVSVFTILTQISLRPKFYNYCPSVSWIVRVFLENLSSRGHVGIDVNTILRQMFLSYSTERDIFSLTNQVLESDMFTDVANSIAFRRRGYRARSARCLVCDETMWGPGVQPAFLDVWHKMYIREGMVSWNLMQKKNTSVDAEASAYELEDSKKLEAIETERTGDKSEVEHAGLHGENNSELGLIIFACGHGMHQFCRNTVDKWNCECRNQLSFPTRT